MTNFDVLPDLDDTTIILCCKNAANSIKICIDAIRDNKVKNLIVIDGNSDDGTQEILRTLGVKFIVGDGQGLSLDRQKGIDICQTTFALFVDSDHVIPKNFIHEMIKTFILSECDFLQSKLRIHRPIGILNKGEDVYYMLIQNIDRYDRMVGLAPSLFRVEDLKSGGQWQLLSSLALTIDDTSWATRAFRAGAKFRISGPTVEQIHRADIRNYIKKFMWYGKGDGEYMLEFPDRRWSMIYHLLFRYPVIYGIRMLANRSLNGLIFVNLQGIVRMFSAARVLMRS
jgi:glycosyltransferase involved in cell wall biosynthesis